MRLQKYSEKMYAGVLGKIIGVYMGRPVEGWAYEAIRDTFDFIDYYVAHKVGAPFIVPDDDISGTFVFYRALEDNGYPETVTSKQIGEAWLNYIAEDRTILWFGGLSRSTEHSAYLRLKQGIEPPRSGSGAMNGMAIAEQIGSQIFIDTWAMVNAGNPARAAQMAREAAVVSHDGIAVECAVYLAALEAMAFKESNVDVLLQECRQYIGKNAYGKQLNHLLDEVISQCEATDDWRVVRDWIEENHNYAKYRGNCPMVPNHLAVIMALKMAGDDFKRSISIATSAGWDTDCNSGNVGCLNGIRLGLKSIDFDADLRGPVADRMYVVSTDGGDCVFDAVRETRKIMRAYAALNHEKAEIPNVRYAFDFPGAVQGFMVHPTHPLNQAATKVYNTLESDGRAGLAVAYQALSSHRPASVSIQTYVDPTPKAAPDTSYFEVYASPALYSTQIVTTVIECFEEKNPDLQFFIDYYDANDEIATIDASTCFQLCQGENVVYWEIPDTKGRAIYRLGLKFISEHRMDGKLVIRSLDWHGAPRRFHMGLASELSPGIGAFVTRTKWMMAFMNSTRHTCTDYLATLAVSHPDENGVMTIGTNDWKNYSVSSTVQFVHAKQAGLVIRAKGHRNYYAGVFGGGKIKIIRRHGAEVETLSIAEQRYSEGDWYNMRLEADGNKLTFYVNDVAVATAADSMFLSGAAGFVVDEGTIVAKTFTIQGRDEE